MPAKNGSTIASTMAGLSQSLCGSGRALPTPGAWRKGSGTLFKVYGSWDKMFGSQGTLTSNQHCVIGDDLCRTAVSGACDYSTFVGKEAVRLCSTNTLGGTSTCPVISLSGHSSSGNPVWSQSKFFTFPNPPPAVAGCPGAQAQAWEGVEPVLARPCNCVEPWPIQGLLFGPKAPRLPRWMNLSSFGNWSGSWKSTGSAAPRGTPRRAFVKRPALARGKRGWESEAAS